MESLPFDSMASIYDETRIFDSACFGSALDFLVQRYPPTRFRRLFEPGIGNGRIAVPLAKRGYQVTGVDISPAMLERLREKLTQPKNQLQVAYGLADATALPFLDHAFDMAIIVHLFYFIKQWKKAIEEILRVTRCGGPFILMHTGNGAEAPMLNKRYKELAAEQGHSIASIGVQSTSEVLDYLKSLGYRVEPIKDRWQWTSTIRLDKALDYMRQRAYSQTTILPDSTHFSAMEKLESDMKQRYGNLAQELEVPNEIYLAIATNTDVANPS